jgi:ethanolamine ammonia-lyase large subunit
MAYAHTVGGTRYLFPDLRTLLARASPFRSGDALAGSAAESAAERVAAQRALADLPLRRFLDETVVPYETDDVTRLILDTHDAAAFAPIAHQTVGQFRDWLLSDAATAEAERVGSRTRHVDHPSADPRTAIGDRHDDRPRAPPTGDTSAHTQRQRRVLCP